MFSHIYAKADFLMTRLIKFLTMPLEIQTVLVPCHCFLMYRFHSYISFLAEQVGLSPNPEDPWCKLKPRRPQVQTQTPKIPDAHSNPEDPWCTLKPRRPLVQTQTPKIPGAHSNPEDPRCKLKPRNPEDP